MFHVKHRRASRARESGRLEVFHVEHPARVLDPRRCGRAGWPRSVREAIRPGRCAAEHHPPEPEWGAWITTCPTVGLLLKRWRTRHRHRVPLRSHPAPSHRARIRRRVPVTDDRRRRATSHRVTDEPEAPSRGHAAAEVGDAGARGRRARGSGAGRGPHHRRGAGQRHAAAPPGDRHRQPEGRRRQDHHRRQPRRLPGRAGLPHPGGRPRSPGQRHHRPRHQRPGARGLDVRRAPRRDPARGLHRGAARCGNLFVAPASLDLAGAEIELVPGVQPGAPAPQRASTRCGTTTTTSSSTARRRSACSRSTPSPPPPRCWCRSSASTTRWRASASSCATSTWCSAT